MTRATHGRPFSSSLLMASLLFQALGGIGGGLALVADPSGANLGMPVEMLEGSPFSDFLIPGLILLVVLGVFPLVVLAGLWLRRKWGWIGALLVGMALITWILVQVSIVGYSSRPPLQVIYGLLGAAIVILALAPSARRYHATFVTRHIRP